MSPPDASYSAPQHRPSIAVAHARSLPGQPTSNASLLLAELTMRWWCHDVGHAATARQCSSHVSSCMVRRHSPAAAVSTTQSRQAGRQAGTRSDRQAAANHGFSHVFSGSGSGVGDGLGVRGGGGVGGGVGVGVGDGVGVRANSRRYRRRVSIPRVWRWIVIATRVFSARCCLIRLTRCRARRARQLDWIGMAAVLRSSMRARVSLSTTVTIPSHTMATIVHEAAHSEWRKGHYVRPSPSLHRGRQAGETPRTFPLLLCYGCAMQALLLRLSYGALDRDAPRFAQRFDIAVTEMIGRSAARRPGGQAVRQQARSTHGCYTTRRRNVADNMLPVQESIM